MVPCFMGAVPGGETRKKAPQEKARLLHHKTVTERKDKYNWIIGAPEVKLIYL